MSAREVPPAEGRPIVGVDLGAGRAWSAAVAGWRNGRIEALVEMIRPWRPEAIICDRFRFDELRDAVKGAFPIVPQVSRCSEAAEDIRALRRMALEGPLSVGPESRALIEASLAQARVKNDEQGSYRLVKRDPKNNTGRDDVAAALVLAAGAMDRRTAPRRAYLGLVA